MRLRHLVLLLPLVACGAPAEPAASTTEAPVVSATPPSGFRELVASDGTSHGFYAGGHLSAENVAYLKGLGVRTVVSLQPDWEELTWDREVDVRAWAGGRSPEHARVEDAGMRFERRAWFAADVRDVAFVDSVMELFQDPELRPIYVHCQYGMDRTGAVVALERVVVEGWEPVDAFHEWRTTTGRCGRFTAPEDTFNAKVASLGMPFRVARAPDCYEQ